MNLIIKGDANKVNRIAKELKIRLKRDNLTFELTEEKQQAKKPVKRQTTKKQVKKEQ